MKKEEKITREPLAQSLSFCLEILYRIHTGMHNTFPGSFPMPSDSPLRAFAYNWYARGLTVAFPVGDVLECDNRYQSHSSRGADSYATSAYIFGNVFNPRDFERKIRPACETGGGKIKRRASTPPDRIKQAASSAALMPINNMK